MKEYSEHLEVYSSEYYLLYNYQKGYHIKEEEWGNKKVAANYMEKYWLSKFEYERIWKQIQDNIFTNQDKGLPSILFTSLFEYVPIGGGCLFIEEDFKRLQECMQSVGDTHFIIVQNFVTDSNAPAFRMKFPADINWGELMSGNFISVVLFNMFHNDYFVFGESGVWGKYSANDYYYPFDIIGFLPKYKEIFEIQFGEISKDCVEEVKKYLPLYYLKE